VRDVLPDASEAGLVTDRQRRDLGEVKLKLLEQGGYIWRATPPEGFWHARKGDLIDYRTALDASFSELAQRIATGTP
jgi:hypothetical protein